MWNLTSDLRILCSNALPLSHRDSTVNKVYYKVQVFFFVPHSWQDRKHLSIYKAQNLPSLKYSIYKHDAVDIADPSSMREECHMKFIIDLAYHRVSVAQW